MSLLQVAVFGSPEVVHNGTHLSFALRKAEALLLYLAVEGGMHSREKLTAFFWPDGSPHNARTGLRNAIALLRHLLADAEGQRPHLCSEGHLLGLDPHAFLELDLDIVQRTYQQALQFSPTLTDSRHSTFPTQMQHALSLVRGPFLDGFWLHKNAPFDQWHEQQQQQWEVRLLLLLDRLSLWQEEVGAMQAAIATLQRWLVLDPLSEEATRRLMRVHWARKDVNTALQVYVTYRTLLAKELQTQPSLEMNDLAQRIRTTQEFHASSPAIPAHLSEVESQRRNERRTPLVGREAVVTQFHRSYERVRTARPQGMLLVGEAGIGKTRLLSEFAMWAKAQGAEVMRGQAAEMGRLPLQLIVDAIRPRMEQENAPEDMLDDLWLSELSRLLPELRVRYPDLPTLEKDELTSKAHLFEAVVQFLHALERRSPLVLLLDDLHWADEASFEVLHYLARAWMSRGARVLFVGTGRSDEMERNVQVAAHLIDVGRQLPLTQVVLHSLSQTETFQLVRAFLGTRTQQAEDNGEPYGADIIGSETIPSQERARLVVRLGEVLFAQTAGHPLYLLEMLTLLHDRHWLIPQMEVDGTWTLEQTPEMRKLLSKSLPPRKMLPPSVQLLIRGRLAKLTPVTRQLMQARAVLGNTVSARLLWQVTGVEEQAGITASEEAIGSGIVSAEEDDAGYSVKYRFTHELIREVIYMQTSVARRQHLHQRALVLLQREHASAHELAYHALHAGDVQAAYRYSVQAGMEAVTLFATNDAIEQYEQAHALLRKHSWLENELAIAEIEQLYVHLAWVYTSLYAWEKAQETYAALLAYERQHSQLSLMSMTLNRMALLVAQQTSDKLQVQALLKQAREMALNSHEQKTLMETEWNQAQIMVGMWEEPMNALPHALRALALARTSLNQEWEARILYVISQIHLLVGDFEEAMHYAAASLQLYEQLGVRQNTTQELSLTNFLLDTPPTQFLTILALEAFCWTLQAIAQTHLGQVQESIHSGYRAFALAQESRNTWRQLTARFVLAYSLIDVGAYEEAFRLLQPIIVSIRTLPPSANVVVFYSLVVLGRMYQVLQQWEEGRVALGEAITVVKRIDSKGPLVVSALSRLCMHYAVLGEWEQAHEYAVQTMSRRKHSKQGLIPADFFPHYEIEALLWAGDERMAREEVQWLGERLGSNRRFRLPYLRSLAVLAVWEGRSEQALDYLEEAAVLAVDLGLPEEQWQVQAGLGNVYEGRGEREQAHIAFVEAERIIEELAIGIEDESLRTTFVAGKQMQQVHNRDSLVSEVSEALR